MVYTIMKNNFMIRLLLKKIIEKSNLIKVYYITKNNNT